MKDRQKSPKPHKTPKETAIAVLKLMVLVSIVIIVPYIIFINNKEFFLQFESVDQVESFILSYGRLSALILVGLQVIQVIISFIPGEIVQLSAGYLFGIIPGFILVMVGCLLAEFICFHMGKLLGRDFIRLFISEENIEKYVKKLNSPKAYLICFILYLIPIVPKDVICYIAGISEMRFRQFLLLSLTGRIPGLLGMISIGALLNSESMLWVIVIGGVELLFSLVCIIKREQVENIIINIESKVGE